MKNAWPMFIGGLAAGLAQALFILGGLWEEFPGHKLALSGVVTVRWITVSLVAAACLNAGWAWLAAIEKRHVFATVWQRALVVLTVTVVAELVGEPLALEAAKGVHAALNVAVRPFWADRSVLAVMPHMWSQGAPPVLFICALATAVRSYLQSLRAAGESLRRIQLAAAESRRRAATQRLHSTQAAVDPPFLFATLHDIEAAFLADPARADRMLDALIRYLRAALPAACDHGCTLGEQADLVRAWAQIAAARGIRAVEPRVEVPQSLRALPFAPMLLLPLASVLVRAGATCLALRAWREPGRLVVQVEGESLTAHAVPPEVPVIRQRLAALYGDTASFETGTAGPGLAARICLQMPAAA